MDLLNQLLAFLGTINPTYAAIGMVVLYLFRDKLPKITLPTLTTPAPVESATPLLDWLKGRLLAKFGELKSTGADDHEAVLHLAGVIKSAGVRVDSGSVPTLTK